MIIASYGLWTPFSLCFQMSQELNIIPREENYVNPYKEVTKKVIFILYL